jgi:hypothetical protein
MTQKRKMSKLAGAIARDLLHEMTESRTNVAKCFLCGRGMVDRGSRFCTDRCREYYDSGFPTHDPHQARVVTTVPLEAWRIVAGPPGVNIGGRYYDPIVNRPIPFNRARRKLASRPLSTKPKFVGDYGVAAKACVDGFSRVGACPWQPR